MMDERRSPNEERLIDLRKKVRFPFVGYPKGWFVVALSEDVPAGRIVPLHYFGRDLVAYRGASGRVHVSDAYCPHLGAHLAHGGTIESETIRCPFHGWRFDCEGTCVEVPYSDKVPPKARLETYPTVERSGAIAVFYDPDRGAPWELPELDDDGWTPGRAVVWRRLATHPQEVFENTVDIAHIGPIHDGRRARIIGKPTASAEKLHIDIEFDAPGDIVGMPGQLNDVRLEVSMLGLGWVVVRTYVRNVDVHARQRIYVTPVDEHSVDIRGIVHVRATDDAAFTEELARLFYEAYVEDFAKDFPIWENKLYLTRPQLAKGDGPIAVYRRWCTQFYAAKERAEAPSAERVAEEAPSTWIARAKGGALVGALANALGPVKERLERSAELFVDAARRKFASAPAAPAESPSVEARESAAEAVRATDAPPSRVASVIEYFDTLETRFVSSAARGVEAVFQWELDGDDGGVFHALVREGRISVQRGAHAKPSVALVMPAGDYVRMVNGDLDGVRAFTSGRGKVKGNLALAMKMRSLFPARQAS